MRMGISCWEVRYGDFFFAHLLSMFSEGSLFVNNSLPVLTRHIIKHYSRGRVKGRSVVVSDFLNA